MNKDKYKNIYSEFVKQFFTSIFLGGIPFLILYNFYNIDDLILYVKSLNTAKEIIYYWIGMFLLYFVLGVIYRWIYISDKRKKSFINTCIEISSEVSLSFMGLLKAFSGMTLSYLTLLFFVETDKFNYGQAIYLMAAIFVFILLASVISIEYSNLEDKRKSVFEENNDYV